MSDDRKGPVGHAIGKVADTLGGLVGHAGAAITTSADGFAESAAIGDRYEIAAGRIVLRRSRSEQVKAVARAMIEDHTTSAHQLQAALEMNETRGVAPPPAEVDSRRRTMIDHLEEAPDDSFDRTYIDQQVLAHEETVKLMRSYGESGDNPQLRSFALSAAPVVERHLRHVQELRAAL